MKYAITGHSKGIGRVLFDNLDAIGFSRSNGYDITDRWDRRIIMEEAADCDVFINNAFTEHFQTTLLYEMFEYWKGRDKLIINIGSDTTCGIKKKPQQYTAAKASLDKASEQLSHLNDRCKVVNVKFGYVNTKRIIRDINPSEFIPIEKIPSIIESVVGMSSFCRPTELLIRP